MDVRMSALKSQYEGRVCRLERELREQQERHHEQRDEPPESSNKVCTRVAPPLRSTRLWLDGRLPLKSCCSSSFSSHGVCPSCALEDRERVAVAGQQNCLEGQRHLVGFK